MEYNFIIVGIFTILIIIFYYTLNNSYDIVNKQALKKGGIHVLDYKKNIFILVISVILTAILLTLYMIFYRKMNNIDVPPTLYTTLFIMFGVVASQITSLLDVINDKIELNTK